MDDYATIFDVRGSAYDRAMRAFPDARAQEFEQLLAPLSLTPGTVVGDVPAGGEYLRRYLPAHCVYLGYDPSSGFAEHAEQATDTHALLPLPWGDAALDAAVSLAGVHHIPDKTAFFADMVRVTRPGGSFVLSDVAAGSAQAAFLDGFVGDWNGTGHEGEYLDDATADQLARAGWTVVDRRSVAFHWCFPDRALMTAFASQLFNVSAPAAAMATAIDTHLGSDPVPGGVGLRWALERFVCRRV